MSQRKTAEEVEDAPRELVSLQTSHRRDGPVLRPVGNCLRAPEPLDEWPRWRQLEAVFGQLWRDRPAVVLSLFVVGEEHAL
jgi:hypothetical protein